MRRRGRGPVLSIANRLAMLFGAITLGVIAVVYVYVVPQLESSLREQRLRTLATTAKSTSRQIRSDVINGSDLQAVPLSDSTDEVEIRDLQFAVAIDAAASRKVATGSEAGDAGRVGEAAVPIRYRRTIGAVVVYSVPLTDVEDNVAVVRRRIITAGGLALVAALL